MRWSDRGSIVVAVVAALGLAVTVLVARAAFGRASEATVRGEAEVLVASLHESAREDARPPSQEQLVGQLARFQGSGLRYVALRVGNRWFSAGTSTIDSRGLTPGSLVIRGERALLVSHLPSPPPPPPWAPPPRLSARTSRR